MIRRRVLAWSLVPVLACAALALVGARVAPARADYDHTADPKRWDDRDPWGLGRQRGPAAAGDPAE